MGYFSGRKAGEKNANTDDGQCWTADRISARLRESTAHLFYLFFADTSHDFERFRNIYTSLQDLKIAEELATGNRECLETCFVR